MDTELGRVLCIECRTMKTGIVGWCERDVCADCWGKHAKACSLCRDSTFAIKPKRTKERPGT